MAAADTGELVDGFLKCGGVESDAVADSSEVADVHRAGGDGEGGDLLHIDGHIFVVVTVGACR